MAPRVPARDKPLNVLPTAGPAAAKCTEALPLKELPFPMSKRVAPAAVCDPWSDPRRLYR